MNEKLKTLESVAELLYAELKSSLNSIDDRNYHSSVTERLLKEAILDAIELKRKIENARGWIVTDERDAK